MDRLLQELVIRTHQRQHWQSMHTYKEDLEEEFARVADTVFLTRDGEDEFAVEEKEEEKYQQEEEEEDSDWGAAW